MDVVIKINYKLIFSVVMGFLVIFSTLIFFPNGASAENAKTDMPYYVDIVKSTKQIDENVSYYDLKLEAGKTEKLELKVKNTSDRRITILIHPYTARTGTGGNIDYSGDKKSPLAKTLPYSFKDIVSSKQEITLQHQEMKAVIFNLNMPKEEFSGVILGGFYIQEKDKPQQEKQKGVTIKNQYAYVIGCKIRESLKEEKQHFTLEKPTLKEWNRKPNIQANLVNESSRIISQYKLKGKITNKRGEVVHTINEKDFSMAPDSKYRLLENILLEKFPSGKYRYQLTITDGKNTWNLEKNFTISGDAIKNVEQETELEHTLNKTFILVASLIVVLIVIGLIFLWKRRKVHEKNN